MILLTFIFFGFIHYPTNETTQLRQEYIAAATDKNKLDKLSNSCHQLIEENSSSRGYCNMIHFLKAKNSINPYIKLREFNVGRRSLDSLILHNPDNIELRYMRHSIQVRVPGFLGYKENLEEDELYMKTKIALISDSSVYQLIYNYLQNSIK